MLSCCPPGVVGYHVSLVSYSAFLWSYKLIVVDTRGMTSIYLKRSEGRWFESAGGQDFFIILILFYRTHAYLWGFNT